MTDLKHFEETCPEFLAQVRVWKADLCEQIRLHSLITKLNVLLWSGQNQEKKIEQISNGKQIICQLITDDFEVAEHFQIFSKRST